MPDNDLLQSKLKFNYKTNMKELDNNTEPTNGTKNRPEKMEILQPVIQVLKETAEKIRSLGKEADMMLD